MNLVQIKFSPWDKSYTFETNDPTLAVGDYVVLETEIGEDLGRVFKVLEDTTLDSEAPPLKMVKRRAQKNDLSRLPSLTEKEAALEICQERADFYQLDLKLVDVSFSLSGNRLNFAFTAGGRIDFRELVKDLTVRFGKSIRLTQIGARDEARFSGDCGACGKPLCCRTFVKDFFSVTSEMAEVQQVVHRGSERISGMCGRLMCCLSFEYEGYQELNAKLPPLGTRVNVDGQRGVVIGHHPLKQAVDVKFPGNREGERDLIIQVDLNRHQKKETAKKKTAPEKKAVQERVDNHQKNPTRQRLARSWSPKKKH
ncbi:MAG: PSP1 domain-containing protein [Patescibacteria group bacterium]|jgi:cell fate regulator YaaT (PSP1 superfamily)